MGKNLSERVRATNSDLLTPDNQAPVINPGDEVETRVASLQSQMAALMPEGGSARQIVADAVQLLRATPKLRQCDPLSVLGGLCTMAQLNLRPGVGGHGWLIPMMVSKNVGGTWEKRWEAQLIIGYQGHMDLARRSDDVLDVQVIRVYANDHFVFSWDYGQLVHEVNWQEPGDLIGWYAVLKLAGGVTRVDRPWSIAQMEEHRDRYAMAKKRDGTVVGPWRDNFEAMGDKTVLLRALKTAPRSYDLQAGLYVDGTTRTNVTETANLFETAHHPQLETQPDVPVEGETDNQPGDAGPEQEGEQS